MSSSARRTGLDIKEAFGQTETVLALGNFIYMNAKPGSLGKPNPIYDIDVVDENGNPCRNGRIRRNRHPCR